MSNKSEARSLAKDQMETPAGVPPSNRHTVRVERNSTPPSLISGGMGGIDTVSFSFRFDDPDPGYFLDCFDLLEEKVDWQARQIKTVLGRIRFTGKMRETLTLDAVLPGGIKMGFTPQSRSFWVEGRLGAMLSGDKDDLDLYPMDFLRVAARRAAFDVARLLDLEEDLKPLPDLLGAKVSLRRLDVTSEISTVPSYGLQLLRGFANVSFAGDRPLEIWGKEKRIETINFRERGRSRGRRKIRFRIYDKGSQSGSHPPGERIRFERQIRFQGRKQPLISALSPEDAAEYWKKGLAPWIGSKIEDHGLKILPFEKAAEEVLALVDAGKLDWQKGERLIGSICVCLLRGENWWKDLDHRDAGYRRIREMRELGISVTPGGSEIDLGEALRIAEESISSSASVSLPDFSKRRKIEPDPQLAKDKKALLDFVEARKRKREAA